MHHINELLEKKMSSITTLICPYRICTEKMFLPMKKKTNIIDRTWKIYINGIIYAKSKNKLVETELKLKLEPSLPMSIHAGAAISIVT